MATSIVRINKVRLEAGLHAIDPAWRFAILGFLLARSWFLLWPLIIVAIFPMSVQNVDMFGTPVVTAFNLTTSERYVYTRQVNGVTFSFRAGSKGTLTDVQTGSLWSVSDGRAETGPYAGTTLGASPYSVEEVFPYHGVAADPNPVIALWQRFDANWYAAIAQRGYGATPGDVHFPPFFPALLRFLGGLVGGDDLIAGMVISQVALIACLALLYSIAGRTFGESTARRTVMLTLLFPTAFFFFSAYTESTFLLFTLLCLLALEKERWSWAGFWAFLAILTRLQGVALVVPLGWTLLRSSRVGRLRRLFALGLPLGGGLLYLAVRALAGQGQVLPLSEPELSARIVPPWVNLWYAVQSIESGRIVLADIMNLTITMLLIVVLICGWRRLPTSWWLYSAATLLILTMRFVDTQPLNSMSRYALTLFPFTVLLAEWSANAWVRRAVVYVSLSFGLFLSAQFFMWGWVG
jgi:Dolichyl-phosphate-mannose-protein mannosyltransferase